MNNKKITKFVLMIFVVSILFMNVYAQYDMDAYMYGNNNAKDLAKANDNIGAYANVSIDGSYMPEFYSVILSYDLLGYTGMSDYEMECESYDTHSICQYNFNIGKASGTNENYVIKLVDDNGNSLATHNGILKYDVEAPIISNLNIIPGGIETTISFDYNDQGSGIDKLRVLEGSTEIMSYGIEQAALSGSVTEKISSSDFGTGDIDVTIQVYDKAGNFVEQTQTITIDSIADFSVGDSFALLSTDEKNLEYCINDYGEAKLVFGITVENKADHFDVDATSIGASAGRVNFDDCTIKSQTSENTIYVCTKTINYDCEYETEQKSVDKEITVKICNVFNDCSGAQKLSASLKIDTEDPELKSIVHVFKPYGDEASYDKIYLGKNAELKLYIEEQSGIDLDESFIETSKRYYFDDCTNDYCVIDGFDNLNTNQGTLRVVLEDFSSNKQSYEYEYIVDNNLPEIVGDTIGLSSSNDNDDLTFRSDKYIIDTSHIRFYSDIDKVPAKVYVLPSDDDSKNILDENYTNDCVYNEDVNLNLCDIDNIHILTDDIENAELNYVIAKPSGTYIEGTLNVDVIEHDHTESNIFSLNQPELVQGSITKQSTIIDQSLLFELDYDFINSESTAQIADIIIDKDSCYASHSTLSLPRVNFITANKVYLDIILTKTSPQQLQAYNQMNVTCNASIYAIKNNKKLAQEIETLNFVIPLSNDPQSVLGDALQAKINEAMEDSTLKLADKLSGVTNFFNKVKQYCMAIQGFKAIDGAVNSAINLFRQACNSDPDPETKQICINEANSKSNGLGKSVHDSLGGIIDKLSKFCQYTNCYEKGTLNDNLFSQLTQQKTIAGIGTGPMLRPEKSLYASMATLCIPGILNNLQQYKFIQCQYIDCLKNRVPRGVPIAVCEQEYKYMMCKYEKGQQFALIPFANIFRNVGGMIKTALENPLSLIDKFAGFTDKCDTREASLDTVCRIKDAFDSWAQLDNWRKAYKQQEEYNDAVKQICSRAGI